MWFIFFLNITAGISIVSFLSPLQAFAVAPADARPQRTLERKEPSMEAAKPAAPGGLESCRPFPAVRGVRKPLVQDTARSSACGMISLRTLALTKAPSRAAIWRDADGTHHRKAECAVHRRFQ